MRSQKMLSSSRFETVSAILASAYVGKSLPREKSCAITLHNAEEENSREQSPQFMASQPSSPPPRSTPMNGSQTDTPMSTVDRDQKQGGDVSDDDDDEEEYVSSDEEDGANDMELL
jgi:hypothetical protein